jgi:CRISPR-associated protein Cas1
MTPKEGHVLPRFDDRWSFLYLEQGRLEQDAASLAFVSGAGVTRIPLNQIGVLLVGPGAVVTHAAMKSLVDNRSLIAWTGEDGIKLYAFGAGGNRSSRRLLRQAQLFCDAQTRLAVVRRMYQKRFPTPLGPEVTIEQVRGMEGARVRAAYQETARRYSVAWDGRRYDQDKWDHADPVNRALSAANSLLYGLCHAAILAAGYSPAIGFIHTGKMLSFVYDMADLYKTDTTVPAAFEAAQHGGAEIERRTRRICREVFHAQKVMERVLPDIAEVLDAGDDLGEDADEFAGRIVTLADRAQVGRLPWERDFEGEGRAVGTGGA